jgi:hypothetical protein
VEGAPWKETSNSLSQCKMVLIPCEQHHAIAILKEFFYLSHDVVLEGRFIYLFIGLVWFSWDWEL